MSNGPPAGGSHIPVSAILGMIGEGRSEREILDSFPGIKKEDILQSLLLAANTSLETGPKYRG